MTTLTTDQQRARIIASRARVTVTPGETWEMYRDRMWKASAADRNALPGDRHRTDKCNCPKAYSLCVYAMYWRIQQPGWTKEQIHGGWGWPLGWLPPSHPDHLHTFLVDGACVWAPHCEATTTPSRR